MVSENIGICKTGELRREPLTILAVWDTSGFDYVFDHICQHPFLFVFLFYFSPYFPEVYFQNKHFILKNKTTNPNI